IIGQKHREQPTTDSCKSPHHNTNSTPLTETNLDNSAKHRVCKDAAGQRTSKRIKGTIRLQQKPHQRLLVYYTVSKTFKAVAKKPPHGTKYSPHSRPTL